MPPKKEVKEVKPKGKAAAKAEAKTKKAVTKATKGKPIPRISGHFSGLLHTVQVSVYTLWVWVCVSLSLCD